MSVQSVKSYVISYYEGQYSDRKDEPICVVSTEQRAEEIISKLDALAEFHNSFFKRRLGEFVFQEDYSKDRVPDNFYSMKPKMTDQFLAIQKRIIIFGMTTSPATPAEMKLFKRLQKEHVEKVNKWKASYDEWRQKHEAYVCRKEQARGRWITDNYKVPSELQEVDSIWKYKDTIRRINFYYTEVHTL